MKIESLMGLFISALVLITLIFNIRKSRRFNCYDRILHHKLVKDKQSIAWKIITFLNEPKLIVIWDFALASVLAFEGHPWFSIWVLATLFFTDLIGIFLKHSIKRQRPITRFATRDGYSFPSGHVLSATIMCLMIWKIFGNQFGVGLFIFLVVSWLLVVISRLNMRAHYPSDILGATSLAILCFSIAQSLI